MVIKGEAGMQLMGDWAKGEFLAAGKVPGKDFGCVAAPGTAKSFTYNVDSFALFKLKDAANQKAQQDLAAAIMSPEFQEVFNLNKGSIPVRLGMKLDKFDDCAKTSAADFVPTAKGGSLVPSIAHGMAVSSAAEGAIKDVVSQFWNDDKMTAAAAMDRSSRPRRTSKRSTRPTACNEQAVAIRCLSGATAPRRRANSPSVPMNTSAPAPNVASPRSSVPFAVRLTEWMPKLVLAPSFVLAFLFIYGLMAWNGYLSLSASRLLPNYDVRRRRPVRDAVGERTLVGGAEEPRHLRRAVPLLRHGHRAAAGHPARPEDPRRGRAAHDLPVPDGAVASSSPARPGSGS